MNLRSKTVLAARGFSLLELLFTVAIIAVLAALMLPVLKSAQGKAQRTRCANNLKQIGTAFHVWAHDHQDKFPMEVSLVERGTLEFAQPGASIVAYKHFQAISNELVETRLLLCPSERTRLAATTFIELQNSNLSYLVNVRAAFGKSDSVLAADRNIRTSGRMEPSYLQFGAGDLVEWSSALHAGSGNVLFSDAHVDSIVSATAANQLTNAGEVVAALPEADVVPVAIVSAFAADSSATANPSPAPASIKSLPSGEVVATRSTDLKSGDATASTNGPAGETSRPETVNATVPDQAKNATNNASVPSSIGTPGRNDSPEMVSPQPRTRGEGPRTRSETDDTSVKIAPTGPPNLSTAAPPRRAASNAVSVATGVAREDHDSDVLQFAHWLGKVGARFTYSLLLLLLAVLVLVEVLRRRKKKKRSE